MERERRLRISIYSHGRNLANRGWESTPLNYCFTSIKDIPGVNFAEQPCHFFAIDLRNSHAVSAAMDRDIIGIAIDIYLASRTIELQRTVQSQSCSREH